MPSSRARRRFGQHFLEQPWATKVVHAIGPAASDVFVEIGPGKGALTRPLSSAASHVVAVELDRDLVAELQAAALPRVTVVSADFLSMSADSLNAELDRTRAAVGSLRIAGNLPYNVASPILFKLAELYAGGVPMGDATVMLQREVADRLVASPGSRDYGVLTVRIGYRAGVKRLLELPPGAFRPAPRIHSTLVRLTFRPPKPAATDERVFGVVTQAIFTRRRKTLANALKALENGPPVVRLQGRSVTEALRDARIDGGRRPETLSIDELVRLADVLA